MARLEKAITNMVDIFMEYADDQGHKRKLCKEELQAMLETEIESVDLRSKINADDIEEAMKTLDKNGDEEINFREFCRCVGMLATCYYHKISGTEEKKGKSKGKGKGKGKGKHKGKGRGKGKGEDEDEEEEGEEEEEGNDDAEDE